MLGHSAAAAAGLTLLGGSTAQAAGLVERAGDAIARAIPASLSPAEMTTLTAALAQLLPADSLGPGAVEAGVPTYIDQSLAGSYKDLLPAYQGLLGMFDAAAQTLGASSFAGLSSAQQVELLTEFEAGTAPGVPASEAKTVAGLFQLLLEHLREGMFGDPMYGGNQGQAGWKLIGYPGVKLVWLENDQTVGAAVAPTGKTAKSYGGRPYNGPSV